MSAVVLILSGILRYFNDSLLSCLWDRSGLAPFFNAYTQLSRTPSMPTLVVTYLLYLHRLPLLQTIVYDELAIS